MSNIKTEINTNIHANMTTPITGGVLNGVLIDMVDDANRGIGAVSGEYEGEATLVAGSNHSSLSDTIAVKIKRGDVVRITYTDGTATTSSGQLALRKYNNEVVFQQTINKGVTLSYTATDDIDILGIYFNGSAITQSGTISISIILPEKGLAQQANIKQSIGAMILGLDNLPTFDKDARTLTFPKYTIVFADNTYTMIQADKVLSYVTTESTMSSNRLFVWNVDSKDFYLRDYQKRLSGDRIVGILKTGYGTATNLVNYYFPFAYKENSGETQDTTTNKASVYAIWMGSQTKPNIDTSTDTITFPNDSWFAVDDKMIQPSNWSVKYVVSTDTDAQASTFSTIRLVCLNVKNLVASSTTSDTLLKYPSSTSNVTLEVVAYDRVKTWHRVIGVMRCNYGVARGFYRADFPFGFTVNGVVPELQDINDKIGQLPSYYDSEFELTKKTIESHQKVSDTTFSIGFMTDLHFSAKGSGYYESALRDGVFRTASAFAKMSRKVNFSTCVFGGDYEQLNSSAKDTIGDTAYIQQGIDCVSDAMELLSDCDAPKYLLIGNHELHYDGNGTDLGISEDEYARMFSKKYVSRFGTTMSNGNAYHDDTTNGVRYIFLATTYPNDPIASSVSTWLNTISNTNLDIVVVSHMGISDGTTPSVFTITQSAINAMSKKPILWLCGHNHADCHAVFGTTLIVSCLQSGAWTNGTSGDGTAYSHTSGTSTESAFTAITIDRTNRKVYCDRFGLGNDRVYNY